MTVANAVIASAMPSLMSLVVAALILVSALVYGWAIARHFLRADNTVDVRMKFTGWFGSVTFIVHLVVTLGTHTDSLVRSLLAIALGLTALAVFAASVRATREKGLFLAFSERVPDTIVSTGIYRWIRHPFYTAYSLTYIMGVIYTFNIFVLISTLIMLGMYTLAARAEHRQLIESELGDAYQSYRADSGLRVKRRVNRNA